MSSDARFYDDDLARAHHADFGWVARAAGRTLLDALAANGLRAGTVVDLGCGSGILSAAVHAAGYDVVGVDLSPAMVALARSHVPAGDFRQGSVFDAELPAGAVGAAAAGEVLGYTADDRSGLDALADVARRVAAALVPGGVFVLDLAGPGRAGPDGHAIVRHDGPDYLLVSEAHEDPVAARLERRITVFRARPDGAWARSDERHELRLLDPDAVADRLSAAGFTVERPPGYAAVDGGPHPLAMPVGWHVFVATRV
jgi:SAM-dependent methyltransferase